MRRTRALHAALIALVTPSLLALNVVTTTQAASAAEAGDVDTSFGATGVNFINWPGGPNFAPTDDVAVLPNQSFYVAGTVTGSGRPIVGMARFQADGIIDNSFGGGPTISDNGAPQFVEGIAVQPDGKLLVGGNYSYVAGERRVFVRRFNTNGTNDSTFGNLPPEANFYLGGSSELSFGGQVAYQDRPGGVDRILLGGWTESSTKMTILGLTLDGALDTTFGVGGRAVADFGVRAVMQDLVVSPSGIYVSGHVRTTTSPLDDDAGIAKFDLNGNLVSGWGNRLPSTGGSGAGGLLVHDASGANVNDHAQSVVVGADGSLSVVGTRFEPDTRRTFLTVSPGGAVLRSGVDPTNLAGKGMHADARGRLLIAGDNPPGTHLRVTRAGEDFVNDRSFGTDGRTELNTSPCPGGTTSSSVSATEQGGGVLVVGSCDGVFSMTRYLATAIQDPISNVAISVDPTPSTSGRRLAIPLSELDRSTIVPDFETLQAAPLSSVPLSSVPLSSVPLSSVPLSSVPLSSVPIMDSPLSSVSLPPLLLSDIPLNVPGGWEAVLASTPLSSVPLSSVLLQQVMALADARAILDEVNLAQLDLTMTPLSSVAVASLLLGRTPIGHLPPPAGGWAVYLADEPYRPGSPGFSLDSTTLAELQLKGDDISEYLQTPLVLASAQPPLAPSTPILQIRLATVALAETPLGDIRHSEKPSLFDCGVSACLTNPTLTQAQADDLAPNVSPTATVGDALALRPSTTMGHLIAGLIPAADFPYERIDKGDLFDLRIERSVDYHVDFQFDCSFSDGPRVELRAPSGFDYVPGTATLTVGAGGTPQPQPDPTYDSESETHTFLQAGSTGGCEGTNPVRLTAGYAPSPRLGATTATARVYTSTFSAPSVTGAPLTLLDGGETGDDTAANAPIIQPDVLYSGWLSTADDVDRMKIPAPPAGSLISVYLTHLPADFDLALESPSGTATRSTPLSSVPLSSVPLSSVPLEDHGADFGVGDNSIAPDTIADVPLSSVPLSSVPLSSVDLEDASAQRGNTDEVVQAIVSDADQGGFFTLSTTSFDNAVSDSPYVLRVKVSGKPDDKPCIQRSYGTTGVAGSMPSSIPSTTETLFLVNQKRFGDIYTPAAAAEITQALNTLGQRADVRGVVLPIEADSAVSQAYGRWDTEVAGNPSTGPCSVAAANAVGDAINKLVDAKRVGLTNLKNIVLVGSDELLPQWRVFDGASLSNESDYRQNLRFFERDTPQSRAAARGNILTDDPYGDFNPSPWLGGQLYLPDVALGRLIETPAEILATVARFADPANDGRLDVASSFTSGYDFLTDGATKVDEALRSRGAAGPESELNDQWTAGDIRNAFNASPNVLSVNAHYDQYRALPAAGNTSPETAELLKATDLESSNLGPDALLFTMGCHAGLNIADVLIASRPSGLDPSDVTKAQARVGDWAQKIAAKKGTYVANTGYGYGDTEVIGYSERLMQYFAEYLDGSATVGQALMFAKHRYIGGLGVAGVYDAKASEEATFYGLPMFKIGAAGISARSVVPASTPAAAESASAEITLRTADVPGALDLQPVTTARGTFYRIGTQIPQVSHFRPITARDERDVTPTDGLLVKGFWPTGLRTKDLISSPGSTNGFDPVINTPIRDFGAYEPEVGFTEMAFPARTSNVTATQTPASRRNTLVRLGTQFFTDPNLPQNRGVMRLLLDQPGVVYRSDSPKVLGPQIDEVEIDVLNATGLFRVVVPDTDAAAVRVLYLDDATPTDNAGAVSWKVVDLTQGSTGVWTGGSALNTGATKVTQAVVFARNTAGVVSMSNNKVRHYQGVQLPANASSNVAVTVSPAPVNGFYPSNPTVTVTAQSGVSYEKSIDGGAFTAYTAPFSVTGDGVHEVRIRGNNNSSATLHLPIDTTNPTVSIALPTQGQTFIAGQQVTPEYTCGDAGSGIASCVANRTQLDTAMMGTKTFTVTATDNVGRTTTMSRTYHVDTRYTFEGFFTPVDNPVSPSGQTVYNKTSPGANVPVKFRLIDKLTNQVVTSTAVVTNINSSTVSCEANATIDLLEELDLSLATSQLSYDPVNTRFHYNWKTVKSWTGCRKLTFTLNDGLKKFALFDFRK